MANEKIGFSPTESTELAQILAELHGVPPEAAAAAVQNLGKNVKFNTDTNGVVKIELPKESLLTRIRNYFAKK